MKENIKLYVIGYAGTSIGLILTFLLILALNSSSFHTLNIFVKIILIILFAISSNKAGKHISGKFLQNYIDKSGNRRKAFWKLFRMKLLKEPFFHEIPPFTHGKTGFDDQYIFYNSWSQKKILIMINKKIFRIQDGIGKFWTFKIEEIKNFRILPKIINDTESTDFVVELEVKLKSNKIESFDISDILCGIDELEQILGHFAKLDDKNASIFQSA